MGANEKNETKAAAAKARAAKLSPERRAEIAKKAAAARWNDEISHAGEIDLAGFTLPCYVTSTGDRLISGRALQDALRLVDEEAPPSGKKPGDRVARLLEHKKISPFIFKEKGEDHFKPVKCKYQGNIINGYRAEVLADICEGMLAAREAGVLHHPRHLAVAQQSEILIRAFARVGLAALIDEATGYQTVRKEDALRAILDKFLKKELAAWAKRFPNEFYKEMFRLKGWAFDPLSVARPGVVGKYTNSIIYERLAPGIVEELQTINPRNERGNRKAKHHQFLTEEVGHPALAQHLHAVMGIMRLARDWDQFIKMMDVAFPKKGQTIPLLLEEP